MKKIILSILLVGSIVVAKAQAPKVDYGIKAGINVANWRGDAMASLASALDQVDILDLQSNPGFHIGAFVEVPVSDRFSIEPALIYSQKGVKVEQSLIESSILNVRAEASVNSHYIEAPIMAKVKLTEGLYVFGGPNVAYLAANKLNTRAGILGFNLVNHDFDIESGFRKVDLGFSGGLGYEFNNGLRLSASYDHGLSNIDENGNFDVFNKNVKASIGYSF